MTKRRRALGQEGERLAAEYLERAGYTIVERNARAGGVEMDLIARRGRTLAFVEVKTRSSHRHGPPEVAVDARKQARLVHGAATWLQHHRRRWESVRFDVVAVAPDSSGVLRVRHWPGAFDAQ